MVSRQSLDQQRVVRMTFGAVEVAPCRRELRQRGERQSFLERIVQPVRHAARLDRQALRVRRPPEPGEHEREPEQGSGEGRLVGSFPGVLEALLEGRERAREVVAHPLGHAQRHGGTRERGVVAGPAGELHGGPSRLLRLGELAPGPHRLRQLDEALRRGTRCRRLDPAYQPGQGLAFRDDVEERLAADPAPDPPDVELGEHLGVVERFAQLDRPVEVPEGQLQLERVPLAQPGQPVQGRRAQWVGAVVDRRERALVVARSFAPRGEHGGFVARTPSEVRDELAVGIGACGEEVVRDRANRHGPVRVAALDECHGDVAMELASGDRGGRFVDDVGVERVRERQLGRVAGEHTLPGGFLERGRRRGRVEAGEGDQRVSGAVGHDERREPHEGLGVVGERSEAILDRRGDRVGRRRPAHWRRGCPTGRPAPGERLHEQRVAAARERDFVCLGRRPGAQPAREVGGLELRQRAEQQGGASGLAPELRDPSAPRASTSPRAVATSISGTCSPSRR